METNRTKDETININTVYFVLITQIIVSFIMLPIAFPMLLYTIYTVIKIYVTANNSVYNVYDKMNHVTRYFKNLFFFKKLTYILAIVVSVFTPIVYGFIAMTVVSQGIFLIGLLILLLPEICLYMAFRKTLKWLEQTKQQLTFQ